MHANSTLSLFTQDGTYASISSKVQLDLTISGLGMFNFSARLLGMLLERPPRRAPDHALNSLSPDITIVRSRWTLAGCHVQRVWHKNDAGHVHVCTRLLFSRTQSLGITSAVLSAVWQESSLPNVSTGVTLYV
jgi:hypothetical protein